MNSFYEHFREIPEFHETLEKGDKGDTVTLISAMQFMIEVLESKRELSEDKAKRLQTMIYNSCIITECYVRFGKSLPVVYYITKRRLSKLNQELIVKGDLSIQPLQVTEYIIKPNKPERL